MLFHVPYRKRQIETDRERANEIVSQWQNILHFRLTVLLLSFVVRVRLRFSRHTHVRLISVHCDGNRNIVAGGRFAPTRNFANNIFFYCVVFPKSNQLAPFLLLLLQLTCFFFLAQIINSFIVISANRWLRHTMRHRCVTSCVVIRHRQRMCCTMLLQIEMLDTRPNTMRVSLRC